MEQEDWSTFSDYNALFYSEKEVYDFMVTGSCLPSKWDSISPRERSGQTCTEEGTCWPS